MRDIKVQFDGQNNTRLLLNESVEGKMLTQQKYLINVGTSIGTDKIYNDRGTEFLPRIVAGSIVDSNAAWHAGNFAAVATLYFCSYHEHPDIYKEDSYVQTFTIEPIDFNNKTQMLQFKAKFLFKDGTETSDNVALLT